MKKVKVGKPVVATKKGNQVVKDSYVSKPRNVNSVAKNTTFITKKNKQVQPKPVNIPKAKPVPARRQPAQPTTDMTVTIQTAVAIASDGSHPHNAEVADLLKSLERGWMNEQKFREVLRNLVF